MFDKTNKKIVSKAEKEQWKHYKKKINNFFLKISLSSMVLVIFIAFIIGLNAYRSTLSKFDNKNIREVKNYIAVLNNQSTETINNLSLAKKYNERWNNVPESKKYNKGINLDLIETEISRLSLKYNISNYDFTMSVPQKIQSEQNKIVHIFVSDCNISFNAPDDIRATEFLDDLKNSLVGYVVINQFSIEKAKGYDFEDLLKISSGQESGILKVKISFKWFVEKKI